MHARRNGAFGLLLVGAVTGGCSNISTSYDWDTAYDFSQLKSFNWSPVPADAGGDPLARTRIRTAVTRILEEKGYREQPSRADFRLAIHFTTREKVDVVDWGYGYGRRRIWRSGSDLSVYDYTEGTLVVDMIDNRTDELVWRGSATGVVSPNRTPQERIESTNRAVEKLLSGFPPS